MTLAGLLGFGGTDRMMRAPEEAIEAIGVALPEFPAIDAVTGEDGRTALAVTADRRVAVVRVRGTRVSGREVTWPMLRQTAEGIVVETGDRRLGDLTLVGVTALDVRRLGQALAA